MHRPCDVADKDASVSSSAWDARTGYNARRPWTACPDQGSGGGLEREDPSAVADVDGVADSGSARLRRIAHAKFLADVEGPYLGTGLEVYGVGDAVLTGGVDHAIREPIRAGRRYGRRSSYVGVGPDQGLEPPVLRAG